MSLCANIARRFTLLSPYETGALLHSDLLARVAVTQVSERVTRLVGNMLKWRPLAQARLIYVLNLRVRRVFSGTST